MINAQATAEERARRSKPIPFSAPMVSGILRDYKTQTRRIVHPQPPTLTAEQNASGQRFSFRPAPAQWHKPDLWIVSGDVQAVRVHNPKIANNGIRCPFGAPGDRLWVRETITRASSMPGNFVWGEFADGTEACEGWRWQRDVLPSIFLPRDLSRIDLEVTGVRVERLQQMSREDAIAEGARHFPKLPSRHPYPGCAPRWSMEEPTSTEECLGCPEMAFANLWNRLHAGADWNLRDDVSPWDANPWVWVIEFKRVRP